MTVQKVGQNVQKINQGYRLNSNLKNKRNPSTIKKIKFKVNRNQILFRYNNAKLVLKTKK